MISIIVPIYNVECYLEPCILSLINQKYLDVEIILVDDGSTDSCLSICEEYAKKDSRIIVLHKDNGGQGSARNMGLDKARGEYISFIDGDDYVSETMYTTMMPFFEQTNCDIVTCGLITHSGVRKSLSPVPEIGAIWKDTESIMRDYLCTHYIDGSPCNKIYKKELWDDLRFPEGVAREDVYIMYRLLAKCNRIVHSGTCEYHYILRPGSSERRDFNPKFLISLQIADDRRDFIKERFPALLPLAEKSCYGARISAVKKIVRSHSETKFSSTLDELKGYLKQNKPLTKEQARDRCLILYFPWLYRIKMDYQYTWRQRVKNNIVRYLP